MRHPVNGLRRMHAGPRRRAASLAVWLPWIIAPLFAFLPLGGCLLVSWLQTPRSMQVEPVVPIVAVVAIGQR
jgi:hypothetical protein